MTMRDERLSCQRCDRRLVDYATWSAAPVEQRRAMKAAGMARGVRRDLCAACYQYLRVNGLLEAPTPEHGPGEKGDRCIRCGHETCAFGDLCRDCADVTYDLQERDLWTA